MRDLAQELIDEIIDHCYGGPGGAATVNTCGLVCKRWLPRTRFRLFSRVILDADNLPPFIDIVDSSSSPILSFIRHLTLRFVRKPLSDELLSRIHCCPNLAGVEACIVELPPPQGEDGLPQFYRALLNHLPRWASNSPSLAHFDFKVAGGLLEHITFGKIIDIVACIPSMEYLGIHGGLLYISPGSTPRDHSLPSRWHTLDMNIRNVDVFLSSLPSLPAIPALRSLAFGKSYSDNMDHVDEFLQRAGGELESLSLSFGASLGVGHAQTVARLVRHTPKLRNLKLCFARSPPLLAILLLLPPYEWDTITFVSAVEDGFDENVWEKMDAALADPRFCTLRRFHFSLSASTGDTSSMITPATKVLMPLASARGILG